MHIPERLLPNVGQRLQHTGSDVISAVQNF